MVLPFLRVNKHASVEHYNRRPNNCFTNACMFTLHCYSTGVFFPSE